jgi:glycosyltransferase involved in cell wall biosynthesis
VLRQTRLRHRGDERLVFVNAWNEWGEGNHLEPDQVHGRQYLDATRTALERARTPFPERPTWQAVVEEAHAALTVAAVDRNGMAGDPAVSIVMPVYNHAPYLERTLASIAAQRDVTIELVAIDDGSSDASAGVIAAFARTAPFPVTLVRQRNAGAHNALNRGMTLAAAPIIALINSDDLYAPGRLALMVHALETSNAQIAISDTEFIDDDDRVLEENALRVVKLRRQIGRLRDEQLLRVLVQVNVAISTGNFVLRRGFVERLGGFADLPICHDWDFLLAATYATDIAFVAERLYRYRLHAHNTQATARLQAQYEGEIAMSRFLARIREHPRLTDPVARDAYLDFLRGAGLGTYIPPSV